MVEASTDCARPDPTAQTEEPDKTLNTFNYFCIFCMRITLYDNKGNFAACQECGVYGSNFGTSCHSCELPDQYIYWRHNFQKNKGDCPETAVCAKCTGASLWSGTAPQITANCRLCLKDTLMSDHGAL